VAQVRPPLVSRGKISERLARTDVLGIGVQVVSADGGETNLHSHPAFDSSWIVLDGRATFYSEGDQVVAELGRNELVMIPAGTPYWFKSSSDKPLVLLHITARVPGSAPGRVDYTPPIEKPRDIIPGAHFEG
jgi:quercetin dioxygenase-like cupin family protein